MKRFRDIDLEVALSVTTGRMLAQEFSHLHNAIQWLYGTDEDLASIGIVLCHPKAKENLLRQYPDLPTEMEGVMDDFVREEKERFGSKLTVERG